MLRDVEEVGDKDAVRIDAITFPLVNSYLMLSPVITGSAAFKMLRQMEGDTLSCINMLRGHFIYLVKKHLLQWLNKS